MIEQHGMVDTLSVRLLFRSPAAPAVNHDGDVDLKEVADLDMFARIGLAAGRRGTFTRVQWEDVVGQNILYGVPDKNAPSPTYCAHKTLDGAKTGRGRRQAADHTVRETPPFNSVFYCARKSTTRSAVRRGLNMAFPRSPAMMQLTVAGSYAQEKTCGVPAAEQLFNY
jgi:hypothetical protein